MLSLTVQGKVHMGQRARTLRSSQIDLWLALLEKCKSSTCKILKARLEVLLATLHRVGKHLVSAKSVRRGRRKTASKSSYSSRRNGLKRSIN